VCTDKAAQENYEVPRAEEAWRYYREHEILAYSSRKCIKRNMKVKDCGKANGD
jgi:hypothetical protein